VERRDAQKKPGHSSPAPSSFFILFFLPSVCSIMARQSSLTAISSRLSLEDEQCASSKPWAGGTGLFRLPLFFLFFFPPLPLCQGHGILPRHASVPRVFLIDGSHDREMWGPPFLSPSFFPSPLPPPARRARRPRPDPPLRQRCQRHETPTPPSSLFSSFILPFFCFFPSDGEGQIPPKKHRCSPRDLRPLPPFFSSPFFSFKQPARYASETKHPGRGKTFSAGPGLLVASSSTMTSLFLPSFYVRANTPCVRFPTNHHRHLPRFSFFSPHDACAEKKHFPATGVQRIKKASLLLFFPPFFSPSWFATVIGEASES